MRKLLRLGGFALVGGLLLAVVSAGAAEADTTPPGLPGPLGTAYDLYQYKIAVTSEQLYDSMSPAAKASWGAAEAKYAASSAGAYRASLLYNNVDSESLAGVTPIKGFQDRLTPMTGFAKFTKVTPGAAGGLAIAVMAFSERANLAGTVSSWMGMDAQGAVCSDPVVGGANPINWLTGQNCDQWKMDQAYLSSVNQGEGQGLVGTWSCLVSDPTKCFRMTSVYNNNPNIGAMCTASAGIATTGQYSVRRFSNFQYLQNTVTVGTYGSDPACGITSNGNMPGTATTTYCLLEIGQSSCGANPMVGIAQQSTDPDRWLNCIYSFTDGSSATASSAHKRESGISSSGWPALNCPPVPAGKTLAHYKVTEMGGQNDPTTQSDVDTLTTYRNGEGSANSALCDTQACMLDLIDLRSGHSCFSEAEVCADWFSSSTRATDYQCQYGGQNKPVQSCYVYANVFNPAKRQAGDAYADPHTGDDPGAGTSVSIDQLNMSRALQSPLATRDCFGGTYAAFNPLEWVVKPIQCGLEWAFVPRPAVLQAAGQTLTNQWSLKAPGQLVAMVGAWSLTPSVSGCSITVAYPLPGGASQNLKVLDACSGPMATTATLSRLIVSAAFTVMVFLAVKRSVSGTVDYK